MNLNLLPHHHPHFVDRRSRHVANRLRRFINNYWLVPVVVVYLQLLTALMGLQGGPNASIIERNQSFFEGIPLATSIISHDFPFALIGHGKALIHHINGDATLLTPAEVAAGIAPQQQAIYARLWQSRLERDTEVGGILNLNADDGIQLAEIPSSNGRFVRAIRGMTPEAALAYLQSPDNQKLVSALSGNFSLLDRVVRVSTDKTLPEQARHATLDSFIHTLSVTSEARYMLYPNEFKAVLGRLEAWRYLGTFHFHNELRTAPSDADYQASYDQRQFVFCITENGFDLHDILDGVATVHHFEVPQTVRLTSPL
ncbi:MAG: hypothetical protein ACE5FN_07475 [Leptospirillia bacterium]